MIPFNEALKRLLSDHPDAQPTGQAYSYDGNYFIELADKAVQLPAVVFDGYFKVDGITGESKPATVLDLPTKPEEVVRLDRRN